LSYYFFLAHLKFPLTVLIHNNLKNKELLAAISTWYSATFIILRPPSDCKYAAE